MDNGTTLPHQSQDPSKRGHLNIYTFRHSIIVHQDVRSRTLKNQQFPKRKDQISGGSFCDKSTKWPKELFGNRTHNKMNFFIGSFVPEGVLRTMNHCFDVALMVHSGIRSLQRNDVVI